MKTKWMMVGFALCGLMLVGCERNEPVGQRENKTDTYGNVDRAAAAANKDQLVADAERQLNSISDEMHRWMESAGKTAGTGDSRLANDYRESRDAMEKAADKARKELQDLRQATGNSIVEENKEFLDAIVKLRKSIDEGKQRVNGSLDAPPSTEPLTTPPAPAPDSTVPSPSPNDTPAPAPSDAPSPAPQDDIPSPNTP